MTKRYPLRQGTFRLPTRYPRSMGKKRARFDWSADPDDPALREVVDRASRSELKEHLEEIAGLVRDIVAMPAARRHELPIEADIMVELDRLADTPPSPALKRQMNYVKRLMCDVDMEEIRRVMQGDSPAAARRRLADRWRTRLLEGGNDALSAFLEDFPDTDRQHLRAVLRRAQRGGNERPLFDAIVHAMRD